MTSAGRPLRVKSAGRQGAHVGANFRNAPVTGQPRPNRLTSAKRQQTTSDEKVHRMRRRRLRAPERELHSTADAAGIKSEIDCAAELVRDQFVDQAGAKPRLRRLGDWRTAGLAPFDRQGTRGTVAWRRVPV